MKKRIAVVGAGIYGITTAIELSHHNQVDLFEKENDILKAASGINQFRLHRGYHYPRSAETTISAIKSEKEFTNRYFEAVITKGERYYAIAKKNSLTSANNYLKFLEKFKLEYSITNLSLLDKTSIDLCVKVREKSIDPSILYNLLWKKLRTQNINVLLNTKASKKIIDRYDYIVICTYSNLNELLDDYPEKQRDYQFELCEKIAVNLPPEFDNKGIVVMDGPFTCVDPYGHTGLSLLGNVVHAIHSSNIGKFPKFNELYRPLLNTGIIKNPPITHYKLFIESAIQFMPLMKKARYAGSMYTFRTILPNKEATDERLHMISRVNEKIITVFASKLASSIECALEVTRIINSK